MSPSDPHRKIISRRFSLPLSTPLRTADGDVTERSGFLIGLRQSGSDGERYHGIGEATPFPGWTESVDTCAERIQSIDNTTVAVRRPLESLTDTPVSQIDTPATRHGLSLAATDCRARIANRSLGAEIAASVDGTAESTASTVPVNATIGDGDTATTTAAAESAVANGFECLKIKIGARPVDEDIARITAVRETVGEAVTIRVDANGAWDLQQARRGLDSLAKLGVSYLEQPLEATRIDEHAQLRGHGVAIAVDETIATGPSHERVSTVLRADAADVIILKPMTIGGPVETVRLAVRALEAGVDPVITTTIDAVIARTAAVHIASAIPEVRACGLATADFLESDLRPNPAPVSDGHIQVPPGPGIAGSAMDGDLF